MKKIFVILLLASAVGLTKTYASHIAGGELYYRYIGDSTGVVNQYLVELKMCKFINGAAMPNSVDIDVCSSCFPNTTIVLSATTFLVHPTLFDCVNAGDTGTVGMQCFFYRGVYTLPGICADYRFTYNTCCRNGYVGNLFNASNQGFHFRAELNNLSANNSSSKFKWSAIRTLCVNKAVNIYFSATDEDLDSLFYRLVAPKKPTSGCGFSLIPYAAGYSSSQPLPTSPANSAVFNSDIGVLSVTPSLQGIYQVAVAIDEFRLDTATMSYFHIGTAFCDVPTIVTSTCNLQARQGTLLDTATPIVSQNPITGEWTIDANCLDTLIHLNYVNEIDCYSVAADGSDFVMTDPLGAPFPIKKAITSCVNYKTQQITVSFYNPVNVNGTYKLRYKTGNDSNTIGTYCGFYAEEFDSISVNVTGCSGIGIVEQNALSSLILWPNPTTGLVWFSAEGVAKETRFTLYNALGNVLQEGFSSSIDMTAHATGVYILQVQQGNAVIYRRLVKL